MWPGQPVLVARSAKYTPYTTPCYRTTNHPGRILHYPSISGKGLGGREGGGREGDRFLRIGSIRCPYAALLPWDSAPGP